MKDCLSVPGLGWKYFNSMRDDNDEPVYTYNDKYMRHFVRQSIKGGRVSCFNQYYKSKVSDEMFQNISKELDVKRNVYEIIESYMKYINDHLRIIKEEYEKKLTIVEK